MQPTHHCRSTFRTVTCLLLLVGLAATCYAENWPCWRGPRGDGSSSDTNIPTIWNGETGENIDWKVRIPGRGHSSPIVWEDSVFVVSCDEDSEDRVLLRIDRNTGKVVWTKTVVRSPLEKIHKLNSYASGTPATDGKLIYVTFLEADAASKTKRTPGNIVVAAYDFRGIQQWLVRPGRFASVHGFCSSPVLYKDLVIVNGDHDGDSYIVALKQATGETAWRVKREYRTRSYVTPIIREIGGRTQMILSGSKCVTSYDPNNGDLHWIIQGPTQQYVASLVYDGKLVYMTAGFPEHHILAIKPDGSGDVTDTHIEWRTQKGCSYVPSPVVTGKYFVVAADNGTASCFEGHTGVRYWMKRLGKHYSASLTTINGLVYFVADDGITKVVRPGSELDVVSENPLGEYCFASPAISDGQIFLRGEEHLYRISQK